MRSSACKTWLGRLTTLLMAFALSSAFVFAQTKTVTGTVVDEMGEPVIGANAEHVRLARFCFMCICFRNRLRKETKQTKK